MYVRQLKQFIRNARPDFDERRYGNILDLMRACQKDGFLRLERDRQGGLRVFASGPIKMSNVPHGWSTLADREQSAAVFEAAADSDSGTQNSELRTQNEELAAQQEARAPQIAEARFVEEPDDNIGNVEPAVEVKAKRSRRKPALAGAPVEKAKRARKGTKNAELRTQNTERRSVEHRDTEVRPRRATRRRTG